ncbi:uncharacterized protein EDB91DRAFT_1083406 [Suillus paluster]|uniref:uncharacterized protein n=1 Tax=Suillus paluster TaxID=48578 RepID=UPI001B8603E9|nr:uncharacterized protein EDB91DRAFT_1083406 [Suillus paluster]KAG1736445.1 hypothetical protein EDB91DRAFT_1083406 [Suillus paluster]
MAKASKNTPAKSTSEGKKNSKITETGSKRGLKGHENSTREEDGDAVSLEPPEIETWGSWAGCVVCGVLLVPDVSSSESKLDTELSSENSESASASLIQGRERLILASSDISTYQVRPYLVQLLDKVGEKIEKRDTCAVVSTCRGFDEEAMMIELELSSATFIPNWRTRGTTVATETPTNSSAETRHRRTWLNPSVMYRNPYPSPSDSDSAMSISMMFLGGILDLRVEAVDEGWWWKMGGSEDNMEKQAEGVTMELRARGDAIDNPPFGHTSDTDHSRCCDGCKGKDANLLASPILIHTRQLFTMGKGNQSRRSKPFPPPEAPGSSGAIANESLPGQHHGKICQVWGEVKDGVTKKIFVS